jgi:hypothetical protein
MRMSIETSQYDTHVDFPAYYTLWGLIYPVMIEGRLLPLWKEVARKPSVARLTMLIAQPLPWTFQSTFQ